MDADGSRYVQEITAPMDSVRWASVLAGIFAVFATLAVLAVLGVAIGLSTFQADQPRNFGIGAGIYGVVSALIAFIIGGYTAARTAAVAGRGNAMLNGAMVWVVTIALIVNFLGNGIGTLLGAATSVVGTAAQAAAPVVGEVVGSVVNATPAPGSTAPAVGNDATGASGVQATVVTGAQDTAQSIQSQVQNVTPQDVENAARDASGAAWTTLLALVLSMIAAVIGGLIGTRTLPTAIAVSESRTPTRNPAR
jgi:hypothetical protein